MRSSLLTLGILLLAGCAGPDGAPAEDPASPAGDGADAAAEGGRAAPEDTSSGSAVTPWQEATLAWMVPATWLCGDEQPWAVEPEGTTHANLSIDAATWGWPFEAAFDDTYPGGGVDIGFYDAAGRMLWSRAALTLGLYPLSDDPTIRGKVPADAAYALFAACAAVPAVDYRAGALEE